MTGFRGGNFKTMDFKSTQISNKYGYSEREYILREGKEK